MSNKLRTLLLAACLVSSTPTVTAYGYFEDDNPFVEAMLRMMEVFGFIDRDRLPMGVPFLPATGLGSGWNPGWAGMGGLGAVPGAYSLGGMPGLGGGPMTGWSALPGVGGAAGLPGLGGGPLSGLGGMPGSIPWNAAGGQPWSGNPPWGSSAPWQAGPPGRQAARPGAGASRIGLLDGIWETNKGAVVIIKADAARLYVSRDRYQDFIIRYDHDHFWWQPRDGSKFRRYRYEMREGRMILADKDNNLLLMRRRR